MNFVITIANGLASPLDIYFLYESVLVNKLMPVAKQ